MTPSVWTSWSTADPVYQRCRVGIADCVGTMSPAVASGRSIASSNATNGAENPRPDPPFRARILSLCPDRSSTPCSPAATRIPLFGFNRARSSGTSWIRADNLRKCSCAVLN
jgi:hypothetical protein